MKKRWLALLAVSCMMLSQPVCAEEVQEAVQEQTVNVSEEAFSGDLANALISRYDSTVERLTGQSADQVLGILSNLAMDEKNMLSGYESATFSGNTEYLRKAYMDGLDKQVNAPTDNAASFWSQWKEGAKMRYRVVLEQYQQNNSYLSEKPELIKEMMKTVGELPADENGNPTLAGSCQAFIIQMLLKNYGYLDSADGHPGPQTIEKLKQFETDNGVSLNGVINDETIKMFAQSGVLTQDLYDSFIGEIQSNGLAATENAKTWAELNPEG